MNAEKFTVNMSDETHSEGDFTGEGWKGYKPYD